MPRFRPSEDIRPVTEFRAHTSELLGLVQASARPMILTQHGRSAAVLLSVPAYERLLEELSVIRDVRQAETEVAKGRGATHAAVAKRLKKSLPR